MQKEYQSILFKNRESKHSYIDNLRRRGDLSYAPGGWSNERKDGHLDKWTPQAAMVSATINFAIATGRLEDRSDERSEEKSEEEEDSAVEEADA